MTEERYLITIEAESDDQPFQYGRSLINELVEVQGVTKASRFRQDDNAMDLGLVEVVATSGATLAIAQGISEWIRRHRGIKLKIERDSQSGSIKAELENIDSTIALAVTEAVLRT